jgi:WS/DGAT/MGAT family acyltransferase
MSEWVDRLADWQHRIVSLFGSGAERGWARSLRRGIEAALPIIAIPVQKASFNQKLSSRRRIAVASFLFSEYRAVKSHVGGTVNDMATALVTTAVGRYMDEHGEPVKRRKLRVLTPVNVRAMDQSGRMGNRISFLLIEAPLWEMDPVERVRVIADRMSYLKTENAGGGIEIAGTELLSLPTPLLRAIFSAGSPPNTLANMICTNVPGPVMPLYTVGHRLLRHFALAPISWEMGINCAITTYNGEITFTWVVDPEALPDLERLNGLLVEAYEEMRLRAGVEQATVLPTADVTIVEVDVTRVRIA